MHAVEPPKQSLSAALRAVREDERDWGASPAVEARLRLAVQAIGAERRRARRTFLAAAAVLAIAIAAPLWRLAQVPPAQRVSDAAAGDHHGVLPARGRRYAGQPAGKLFGSKCRAPRSRVLGSIRGWEMPAKPTVLADVLVGDDGLARAVRFVQPIRRDSEGI